MTSPRIAFYLRALLQTGIERNQLNLAQSLVQNGIAVDFVLNTLADKARHRFPSGVRIVDLKAPRLPAGLPLLVRYLRQEQPLAMISAQHLTNEAAVLAHRLAGVSTKLIVSEHNHVSAEWRGKQKLTERLTPLFVRILYPWADGIVAVSQGVAQDLAAVTRLPRQSIEVIYNSVVTPKVFEQAKEPVEHTWFGAGEPPVILGVGRLHPQKDFPTLIRAFARVRREQPARLVILGGGPERQRLQALVRELALEEDVALLGFVPNPFAYMARAAVFVLSSAWEGFGNVIAEAMAVGTPVVSTDCPSGPAEILDNGQYGHLVPVGNSEALSQAVLAVLAGDYKTVPPGWLDQFTPEVVVQKYQQLLGLA
ncbi:MAG: glycosyltransferase [Cyanophyceae cyanobacterium]